jgi:hypothetical protein
MNYKILLKPINFLSLLLFISAVYLSFLVSNPSQVNYYIMILMIIALNIIGILIIYISILKQKLSNIRLISFKGFTFSSVVTDIIYLGILYLFFTPDPFSEYLLYYILLLVFIFLSFSITSLKINVVGNTTRQR